MGVLETVSGVALGRHVLAGASSRVSPSAAVHPIVVNGEGPMSQLLVNDYLNDLATLKRVSGAQRKSVVRVTPQAHCPRSKIDS